MNGDTVLQDVTKRVSTNSKTELWKNVAKFIDRMKNVNRVVHDLTMKKDVDKLMHKIYLSHGDALAIRPTLM